MLSKNSIEVNKPWLFLLHGLRPMLATFCMYVSLKLTESNNIQKLMNKSYYFWAKLYSKLKAILPDRDRDIFICFAS